MEMRIQSSELYRLTLADSIETSDPIALGFGSGTGPEPLGPLAPIANTLGAKCQTFEWTGLAAA
jgi:hypothetical protein